MKLSGYVSHMIANLITWFLPQIGRQTVKLKSELYLYINCLLLTIYIIVYPVFDGFFNVLPPVYNRYFSVCNDRVATNKSQRSVCDRVCSRHSGIVALWRDCFIDDIWQGRVITPPKASTGENSCQEHSESMGEPVDSTED